MNAGTLPGFTKRVFPAGDTYPQLKVIYVPASFSTDIIRSNNIDTVLLQDTSADRTLTIAANAGLTEGKCVHIVQWGGHTITVAAGSGVLLRCAGTPSTRAQYSIITVMKVNDALNEYLVFGDITV